MTQPDADTGAGEQQMVLAALLMTQALAPPTRAVPRVQLAAAH